MIELFDHQLEGIKKADNREAFAYAMIPGTGKTYCVLQEALNLYNDNKINKLIVIHIKLLGRQWLNEINKFYEGQVSVNVNGLNGDSYTILKNKLNVFLINIESLSRNTLKKDKVSQLLNYSPDRTMICIDESGKIKNVKTKMTKYMCEVGHKFGYRRILNGTLITESVFDVYSQFRFLDPNIIGLSWTQFQQRYGLFRIEYGPFGHFKKIIGYKDVQELMDRLDPYVYTAEFKGPEKIYLSISLDMSKENKDKYKRLEHQCLMEILDKQTNESELTIIAHAMAKFHKFHELIAEDECKYLAILEILEKHPNDKKIVWVTHHFELDKVYEFLTTREETKHLKILKASGRDKISDLDKGELVENDIIICMQSYASHGLDLPQFTVNIFFSILYSYDKKLQAEARTYRLVSKNPVYYYRLKANGTIDYSMDDILQKKHLMVTDIIKMLTHKFNPNVDIGIDDGRKRAAI